MMRYSGVSIKCLAMTVLVMAGIALSSCSSLHSPLPLTEKAEKPLRTAVYVGTGAAYRFVRGGWERLPSYDYEFSVVRRFHEDGWESVKEIHRRHPDYDGRAGGRDQTLYFRVKTGSAEDKIRTLNVQSSWGQGTGTADADMGNIVVEFSPDISRFAPFNTFRITQKFLFEEGKLRETVEIFKKQGGQERPFMKTEEEADIYMPMKK
ncbi:MAG TPA: hypothetical protein VEP69_05530 [Thermodesulfovibrionales bacterium]|nr:hypothetical protein [Thermodesulfovibrionales bacterium]